MTQIGDGTWGIIGTTPIAALNTQGKFQIANSFTANGGGIFNGSILSQGIPVLAVNNTFQSYSTDHILNRPFVIRRNTSNNEAFFHIYTRYKNALCISE
jgi:hypothetical protein